MSLASLNSSQTSGRAGSHHPKKGKCPFDMLSSVKDRLISHIPLITFLFCIVQPLLDVLGFWQDEWGISNAGTLVCRSLILLVTVLMGFVISSRRGIYLAVGAGIGILLAGHFFACVQAGGVPALQDFANQVRIFSLPLTTLCVITFLKYNPKTYDKLKLGIVCALAIIIAVQMISTLTGTDPHTYPERGYGVLGWFLWPNTQSAILSIVVPITVAWSLNQWRDKVLPVIVTCVISMGSLYLLAPRLSYAAMIACGLGMGICLLLIDRRRAKQAVAIMLCAAMFIFLYPVSPLAANRSEIADYNLVKQDAVDQILADAGLSSDTLAQMQNGDPVDNETEVYAALEEVYGLFLQGVVDRFGIERVAQQYSYTTDASVLSDVRKQKITFCTMLLEDSPVSSLLFGLDVERMREDNVFRYDRQTRTWNTTEGYYDVENDLHGIFFLCGIVGLAAMLCFLLYFGLRMLVNILRDFKRYFTCDLAAAGIAYICALAHIVFTASLLRRNNGSVYLAFLFGIIWYTTDRIIPVHNHRSLEDSK